MKEGGKGAEGKGKTVAKIKKEEPPKKEETIEVETPKKEAEEAVPPESMKEFLEEAHKMLKSLSATRSASSEENFKSDKLSAMQQQLDELRKLKVLRLSRITRGEPKFDCWTVEPPTQ